MQRRAERQRTWCAWRDFKLALAAATVLYGSIVSAQQRAGETIEVSIVNVDVHVTDKDGKPVRGLGPGDFEIREEGRVQPVTNFSEYGPAPAAPVPAVPATGQAPSQPAPEPAPTTHRTIVLFFEPMTLPVPRAKELFDSIRAMMHKSVRPGDRAMIVTWESGARIRQPLTGELRSLDQVLGALEEESTHLRVDTAEQIRTQQAFADAEARNYENAIGQTGAAAPSMQLDAVMAAKMQFSEIEKKILAVRATMESISAIEGTKVLLLATKRLGAYAGAEYFGGTVPPNYRKELDTTKLRASLTSAANAKGVTIYPLYFEGLVWASSFGASNLTTSLAPKSNLDNNVLMNETVALQEIAEETGGVASWGSKDIAAVLPRVSDELEAYYSLGYSARSTGKDVARRIVVTTKNPDYVVRARRQFVEMSDAARMKDRVAANLFAAIEGSTIRFDVGMEPIKEDGKDRWTTTLKIHVPIASLMTLKEGKGEAGSFSVFVTTGSPAGAFSAVEQRTQSFNIAAADLERAKTSHYTYDFVLQLDKVVDRASVGVMDETSKEFGLKRIRIPPR